MRTADDDGAGTALARHDRRRGERAQGEPRPGQPVAIPGLRGEPTHQHRRLTGSGHPVVSELVEVRREQRETVRRMTEQVAVEQYAGDVRGDVAREARALQQRAREDAQVLGRVARVRLVAHR